MDKINFEEIGNRIRNVREAQGLTQEKASERCDITTPFYGNIERGDRKMSVETLIKISKGLGISADHLLFGGTPQRQEVLDEILSELQRNSDDRQFEKYLIIIKNLAEIIDEL